MSVPSKITAPMTSTKPRIIAKMAKNFPFLFFSLFCIRFIPITPKTIDKTPKMMPATRNPTMLVMKPMMATTGGLDL